MKEGDKKFPVSVDIGVGLKASLEVKTEIPPETTGQVISALVDIIRPFTEGRGLKADQIRLQREEVALEIARIARERAVLENLELKPVPTKLLIPFLEKASLEDQDQEMQERWASLLLSASTSYNSEHLTFVDILSRLSSSELHILEDVCFSYKAFPEVFYPGGHFEENRKKIESKSKSTLIIQLTDHAGARAAYNKFSSDINLAYGKLIHARVQTIGGNAYYFYGEYRPSETTNFASVRILERERLVDVERFNDPLIGVDVGYFNVTELGVRFVQVCSPQAKEKADRRPKPKKL